ncbi:MAG: hypothetical protein AB7O24_17995 [Kofleriaceae bacterium]
MTAIDRAGNQTQDTLQATRSARPPAIAITGPSDTGEHTTAANEVDLAGTASGDVALTVVSWFNTTTGDGGTATWMAGDVPRLHPQSRIALDHLLHELRSLACAP